jgi:hypothetical protein
MKEAHRPYWPPFKEIAAYEGSEIPEQFRDRWVFMEMAIRPYEDHEVGD